VAETRTFYAKVDYLDGDGNLTKAGQPVEVPTGGTLEEQALRLVGLNVLSGEAPKAPRPPRKPRRKKTAE